LENKIYKEILQPQKPLKATNTKKIASQKMKQIKKSATTKQFESNRYKEISLLENSSKATNRKAKGKVFDSNKHKENLKQQKPCMLQI
jgi:hypothetical protein